jgi:hypothetical protein
MDPRQTAAGHRYPRDMVEAAHTSRLAAAAEEARSAEAAGEEAAANEAWRRYRRIRDAARDPNALLLEGIALSEQARALAALDRHSP